MASLTTQYTRLNSTEDLEEDLPPQVCHVGTRGHDQEHEKGRWNHIENLDEFFIRIYEYHRHHGFFCILFSQCFELVQFVFVVLFTTFLILCVDYDKLFNYRHPTFGEVIHFHKVKHMEAGIVACLVIAFIFWLIRLARIVIYFFKLLEIRSFYRNALKFKESELSNLQWQDVQKKLIEVQKVHHMCVHKQELTELDIHHRILRWKNYMIAMQNKSVIPSTYRFPFIGTRTFLTEGVKYNLKMILFWGPGSPFQDYWKLKDEYKNSNNRHVLAARLSSRIFWLAIANFLLCPFIFVWVVLYSFFSYAEMVKRAPDAFGARKWSQYGKLFFRHFNELEHEFHTRLSRAYEPATKYMNIFVSPLMTIICRNIAFLAGSIFAVLTVLTILDKDVLFAEHVLTVIAGLGILIKGCYTFIPDEHMVWCPEQLMKQILSSIHYIPDNWKGRAHTSEVRDQFAQLFQYKMVFVLEELLSPLVTPFLLMFSLRYKALDIVDFFHNFTVEVVGVGDVCSFAQLDVKKHGNPEWLSEGLTRASQYEQAENGKTELSLVHFSIRNPAWKPSEGGMHYISTIKENAEQEGLAFNTSTTSEPYSLPDLRSINSLHALPYIQPMSLSDPMGSIVRGEAADTPQQRAQQTESLMNSSMMYIHQLRNRQTEPGESLHQIRVEERGIAGVSGQPQTAQVQGAYGRDDKRGEAQGGGETHGSEGIV